VWNVRAAKRRPKRRNPVHLAREWRAVMDAHGESRADLARRLGVSRARVTQVLQILDLDPLVLAYVDRHSGGGISERVLRRLRGLSPAEQRKCIADLAVPVRLADDGAQSEGGAVNKGPGATAERCGFGGSNAEADLDKRACPPRDPVGAG
jgi:ParB-like chromosome segregation protein Spo0J